MRFSSALVEIVDLFVTLADLAGLPAPPLCILDLGLIWNISRRYAAPNYHTLRGMLL